MMQHQSVSPAWQGGQLRVLQLDTERGWRGGQRQTFLLARELMRRGHLSFVAARPGEPLSQRARAAGIPVVAAVPTGEVGLITAYRLRRIIKRHGIQVVHAQAAHAVMLGALAVIGTDARLVVTRHLARAPRANRITRWKYSRADAVMAVSNAAARALESAGLDASHVKVVPGGVEVERDATPATARTLASFGVPAGVPLAVMVGALVLQKDPVTFVRAIAAARKHVPALHALLVGDGELRPSLEAEVLSLGLQDCVHFAGFRDDVDALLSAGTVAVLSSRFEGLPLVIMDAFALGVPVAATAGSGIPELVEDGVTGLLVPVGQPAALGDAIARIVRDPALAATLREGGRRRVQDYSVARMVDATERVYAEVLSAPVTPGR